MMKICTMVRGLPFVLLMTPLVLTASGQPPDAVECRPRGGLPNVLAKLEAGEAVCIAYLGGSITAAPGWRVKSLAWFRELYPSAQIDEINAAIGGTGSHLGAFRVGQDVLRHEPDLLFIEFAVNDGETAPESIRKTMEGIVRQTWLADAKTDICFVYTINQSMLEDTKVGRYSHSAAAMEEVADHYAIPSVHLGLRIAEMERNGELVFAAPKPQALTAKPIVFSKDGVHPFVETGHELYVRALIRSMPLVAAAGSPGEHPLPPPLRADNYEHAHYASLTTNMLRGAWELLDEMHPVAKNFRSRMPRIYMTSEPGAAVTVTFKGTTAGMLFLMGPDCGKIAMQVDDRPATTQVMMDGYCTYHRVNMSLPANGIEDAVHTVTMTLLPDTLDKKAILGGNAHDLEENPEKYEGHRWYIGAIPIIGDVAE